MIELHGWIWDFDKMEAVDYKGQEHRLMVLNYEIYVQLKITVENPDGLRQLWHWPRFPVKLDNEAAMVGWSGMPIDAYDYKVNKEISEAYKVWMFEKVFFNGPGNGC